MNIDTLRNEIDILDSQLITILSKRFIITREIGQLKKLDNSNPTDINRLNTITANWVKQALEQNINPELALQLINSIHHCVIKEHEAIK